MNREVLAIATAIAISAPTIAMAHGVEPIGASIVEDRNGRVHVRVARPAAVAPRSVSIELPSDCVLVEESSDGDERSYACERSLAGRALSVTGLTGAGGEVVGLEAALRIDLADEPPLLLIATARTPSVRLERPTITPEVEPGPFARFGSAALLFGFASLPFVAAITAASSGLGSSVSRFVVLRFVALALALEAATFAICGWLHLPAVGTPSAIVAALLVLAATVASGANSPRASRALALAACAAQGLASASATLEPRATSTFTWGLSAIVALDLALAAASFPLARALRRRPSAALIANHALGGLGAMYLLEALRRLVVSS
ncbi:MAG: hypothetical protein U0271_23110 [Polyangiaceae bacterium]